MSDVLLAGRYRLESEVASGGMATVHKAVDEVLDRVVAAKLLHKRLVTDSIFLQRFKLEALAAARLTHPSIVSVFDTGEHDGVPFMVMEFLPGGTLRDLMNEEGALEYAQAASIAADVCAALSHAHSSGIVHRDIKPGNILFSEGGHTKVADFGIAKAAFGPDLTDTGALLGTVRYLAPEQVEGSEPDARSDIYSLGVVLYEMVTGRPPFVGDNDIATATARVDALPKPPRDLRPGVPRKLEAIIMKALAPDPQERYQTAEELSEDLSAFAEPAEARMERTAVVAPVSKKPESFVKSEGRWLVRALLLLLVAAGIVVGAVALELIDNPLDLIDQPLQANDPISIVSSGSFDPEGQDKEENDDEIGLAFDGNESTRWRTDTYATAEFGDLKEGLGVFIDLGSSQPLKQIEVSSVTGGWEGMVRFSDDGEIWSEVGASERVEKTHRFQVQAGHRYYLIWITKLVRSEGDAGEHPFWVGITEIKTYR
ncbi:MAG TPA: protein kinase [Actinomycetota bacterium]|nr:protein kinase [Actinomycetota bacterium]